MKKKLRWPQSISLDMLDLRGALVVSGQLPARQFSSSRLGKSSAGVRRGTATMRADLAVADRSMMFNTDLTEELKLDLPSQGQYQPAASDQQYGKPSLADASEISGSRSNQVERNVDIAVRGFRIRTELFGFFNQRLGDAPIQTGQADIETSAQEVVTARKMQVDFGVDDEFGQNDLSFAGRNPDRALEASRPTSRKKLLRIGAGTQRAW